MTEAVDLEAVKQVQQKVWAEGDFAMIGATQLLTGERLCERLDILPDERCLDVACGPGNTTLAAARRAWGNTVGIDYVPAQVGPPLREHEARRARIAVHREQHRGLGAAGGGEPLGLLRAQQACFELGAGFGAQARTATTSAYSASTSIARPPPRSNRSTRPRRSSASACSPSGPTRANAIFIGPR